MQVRDRLLGSASLATLMALAAGTASAQSLPDGYTLFLQGGTAEGSFFTYIPAEAGRIAATAPGFYDLSDRSVSDRGSGFDGSVGLRRNFDAVFDAAVVVSFAAINDSMETAVYDPILDGNMMLVTPQSAFGQGSGGSSSMSSDFQYETVDLELGRRVDVAPWLQTRVFGGVSVLHFDDATDLTLMSPGSNPGNPMDPLGGPIAAFESIDSEFWGAGPRIGIEGAARLQDMPIGISGMVAGAVFIGELDSSNSVVATGPVVVPEWSPGPNSSHSHSVFQFEAELGLDYYIDDSSVLTVGYQLDNLWDVREQTPLFDDARQDQLVHGVFARLKITR